MLDIKQFDEFVVAPTLEYIGMGGLTARQLIVGTALVESGLHYIKQLGGVALGFEQVEPSTFTDNYDNFLRFNKQSTLLEKINNLTLPMPCGPKQMMGNMYLNVAHARIKYWRSPKSLPKVDDFLGMAMYHKEIYNTIGGATDVVKSAKFFKQVCEEIK